MGIILQIIYGGEVEESYIKGENENAFGHYSVLCYISDNDQFFPCICNNLKFMLLNYILELYSRSESISLHVITNTSLIMGITTEH